MAEPTMLEESIKEVGANKGQPGMLTPQQMIALEEEAAKKAAAGGEQQRSPTGEPPKPPEKKAEEGDIEFNHDALLAKVEKGEELTPDEKATLAMMEADLRMAPHQEPTEPEKTYRIGDKEYTRTDLLKKIREQETDLGDLKISPQTEERIINWYIKSANRSIQQRANQQESERLAHERRVMSEQSVKLNAERARYSAERAALQKQIQMLEAEKKELQEILKHPLTAEEVREKDDPDMQAQYIEQRAAARRVQQIEKQQKEIVSSEAEVATREFQTRVELFVAEHPQYRPKSGDVFSVWDKVSRGEQVDQEDKLKVQELDHLFVEAATRRVPIEDLFAYYEKANRLAIKPEAQSLDNGRRVPPEPKRTKTVAEIIREHKERGKLAPPVVAGGGAQNRGTAPPERVSTHMVKEAQKVLGEDKGDFLTKELGFS
jgi:hypothetical protein